MRGEAVVWTVEAKRHVCIAKDFFFKSFFQNSRNKKEIWRTKCKRWLIWMLYLAHTGPEPQDLLIIWSSKEYQPPTTLSSVTEFVLWRLVLRHLNFFNKRRGARYRWSLWTTQSSVGWGCGAVPGTVGSSSPVRSPPLVLKMPPSPDQGSISKILVNYLNALSVWWKLVTHPLV